LYYVTGRRTDEVVTEVDLLLRKEHQMFSKICRSIRIHGHPNGANRASYWIMWVGWSVETQLS